jgi:hypothetical protein
MGVLNVESGLKKFATAVGIMVFLAAVIATLIVMFSATSSEVDMGLLEVPLTFLST